MLRHMTIGQLPYGKPVQRWLKDRFGEAETNRIWKQTQENYRNYLQDLPDCGGSRNGHAGAICGGLLIFSLYPALPDQPPVYELQSFVQNLFMAPFTKLGKIFDGLSRVLTDSDGNFVVNEGLTGGFRSIFGLF